MSRSKARGRTPEKILMTPTTSTTNVGSNGRRRYVGRSLTMDLNQQINAHFSTNSIGTTPTSRRSSTTSNSASSFTTHTKLSTLTAAYKVSSKYLCIHDDRWLNIDLFWLQHSRKGLSHLPVWHLRRWRRSWTKRLALILEELRWFQDETVLLMLEIASNDHDPRPSTTVQEPPICPTWLAAPALSSHPLYANDFMFFQVPL